MTRMATMRKLQLTFGLTVVAVMVLVTHVDAEEQVDPEQISMSSLSESRPRDPHLLEEQTKDEPPHSRHEGAPFPHPVEQDRLRPSEKADEVYPKKFRNDTATFQGPVPAPEEVPLPLPAEDPHSGAEGNATVLEDDFNHAAVDNNHAAGPLNGTEEPRYSHEQDFFPGKNDDSLHTLPGEETRPHDREEEVHHHQHVTDEASTPAEVEGIQGPVVMPVTEGKNKSKFDPVAVYGLPKELMPIHPGGGSRFDDLEKEKLERAKMAQTKVDDDDIENGNSYDAEGLYSSAAKLQICFTLFSSLLSVRMLI
ncbi:uncharacterized protein LOC122243493 isoform X1 [Penaeus japonicus]|uniref:uncharacterized protein LOC122243493 isoform X1 n=1 Tax=Penaeus japonicus TaxID=27405 RepID=UPI001C716A9D|nr:uncharacterized protein LOC122243493 isoform X1 [Penaeus japonicus]